jgi:hypothetical protein
MPGFSLEQERKRRPEGKLIVKNEIMHSGYLAVGKNIFSREVCDIFKN